MNEPSPEAKQAAKDWISVRSDLRVTDDVREGFVEGYDTATAKAQKEIENQMDFRQGQEDRHKAETAKLREELAEAQRTVRSLAKQLAHQQPGAGIRPDCKQALAETI